VGPSEVALPKVGVFYELVDVFTSQRLLFSLGANKSGSFGTTGRWTCSSDGRIRSARAVSTARPRMKKEKQRSGQP